MNAPSPILEPNIGQLSAFVRSVFKHATVGTFISLRAFPREAGKPALFVRGFEIKEDGLDNIIAGALIAARDAANHPLTGVVFSPPTATFDGNYYARLIDVVDGLVISTECDEQPRQALEKLRAILGSPTLVIESGGQWVNPETGDIEPKLHLYWRLAVPARDPEGFDKLREAREIATRIVGADTSNISIVHPTRWPGSWHTKNEPRLCHIVGESEHEVDLDEALQQLRRAAPGKIRNTIRQQSGVADRKSGTRSHIPEAGDVDRDELLDATMAIPNDNIWETWKIDIGMSLFKATEGSEAGLEIWILWSKQSLKFNERKTRGEWEKIRRSPPTIIGKRKIFRIAQEEHGWARKLKVSPGAPAANDDAVCYEAATGKMCEIVLRFINECVIADRKWTFQQSAFEINHRLKWFPGRAFAVDTGGGKTHVAAEELANFIQKQRSEK